MSAEVESMMYVGATPWHGEGTKLDKPPTAAEAIIAAGLDWKVEKRPVHILDADGSPVAIPGKFAVTRDKDNRVYSVLTDGYNPLQNVDAFAWFNPFIESKQATFHTAGSLRDGQKVWILAQLGNGEAEVAKGDPVENFLLLTNGHDGRHAVGVRFTPVRVVCSNTLSMAQSMDTPHVSILHSARMGDSMEKVQEIIDVTNRAFTHTLEQYRALAAKKVGVKAVESYVLDVLEFKVKPDNKDWRPKALEQITESIETSPGHDIKSISGSLWRAYNGVTHYVDYIRGDDATRLDSAWFGVGARLKERALEVAIKRAA